MKLHKEGKKIILISPILIAMATLILWLAGPDLLAYKIVIVAASLIFYFLIIRFFRVPNRVFFPNSAVVFAPADGEIVVMEEVFEDEFIKDKCLQISVFMSPLNVHINWFPFDGIVKYYKYHPGKYLVAWHPKSSLLNERTSVCVENKNHDLIMIRQIAGAVARRIVCYAHVGQSFRQNDELGFIKFGSRVDLYLPLSAKPMVKLNDKVVGGKTIVAEF